MDNLKIIFDDVVISPASSIANCNIGTLVWQFHLPTAVSVFFPTLTHAIIIRMELARKVFSELSWDWSRITIGTCRDKIQRQCRWQL